MLYSAASNDIIGSILEIATSGWAIAIYILLFAAILVWVIMLLMNKESKPFQ